MKTNKSTINRSILDAAIALFKYLYFTLFLLFFFIIVHQLNKLQRNNLFISREGVFFFLIKVHVFLRFFFFFD